MDYTSKHYKLKGYGIIMKLYMDNVWTLYVMLGIIDNRNIYKLNIIETFYF